MVSEGEENMELEALQKIEWQALQLLSQYMGEHGGALKKIILAPSSVVLQVKQILTTVYSIRVFL